MEYLLKKFTTTIAIGSCNGDSSGPASSIFDWGPGLLVSPSPYHFPAYLPKIRSFGPPEKVPPKLDDSKKLHAPHGLPRMSGRLNEGGRGASVCVVEICSNRPFSSNRNREFMNPGEGEPMNCGVEIATRRPLSS